MANPKCYIGSQAIREYEHDLQTGVSQSLVERHAEHRIKTLRTAGSSFARIAADQIENWLVRLVNP